MGGAKLSIAIPSGERLKYQAAELFERAGMLTGTTLRANPLKILADGLIVRSQAHLLASSKAAWSSATVRLSDAILARIEVGPWTNH